MRIVFDLRKVGLGNNGGSFTLIKSGNTLVDMGHDVTFVDSGKNQHTWVPLKANHKVVRQKAKLPTADFIIATGFKSVEETITSPPRAGRQCHWIRAFETWQYSEKDIINKVLKTPTIKLVNGLCLQNKLESLGFKSYLIRPGYDFENLTAKNIRHKNNKIILGGLNKQGPHANRKRTSWIFETAKILKRKYKDKIELWMFGMEDLPVTTVVDKFIKNPSIKEKNDMFNHINIWLAPTMSEGLHMPPAEAMITECPVVGTNAELAGTIDYLFHNKTGIVTENDIHSFINGVEVLINDEKLRNKLGKNARIRILEIGNRTQNMERLINLFSQLQTR